MSRSEKDKAFVKIQRGHEAGQDPDQELHNLPLPWIVTPENNNRWSIIGLRLFFWGGVVVVIAVLGYIFWPGRAGLRSSSHLSVLSRTRAASGVLIPRSITLSTPTVTALSSRLDIAFLPALPAVKESMDVIHRIPTPPPGGIVVRLTPEARAVGWASSLDGRGHFKDPNIHVGFFNGHIYYGAVQFDLSAVPVASRITCAALELVGLGDQNLSNGGIWQVRLLETGINEVWPALTYDKLHQVAVQISILPELTSTNLGRDRHNVFPFGPEQLAALQQHQANGVVAFRLDGPNSGDDNLFTWDSGYNAETELQERLVRDEKFTEEELIALNRKPVLWIVTDRVEYVAITVTPTPQNIFTAAAMAATATARATAVGTATPLPAEWATPIVVTVPPPPANAATATYEEAVATAEAIAFGTAAPTPLNLWTATPTPGVVYVTSTPTPENVITRAAIAAQVTYVTQTIGTLTPVPANWATPFVVTPQPAPHNTATAEFYRAAATAETYLYGMVWTATPTSIFITPTPAPTFTPTPGYEPISPELVGKIAFLSDRAGRGEETGLEPLVYAMDPDGRKVTLMSNRAAYDTALARDSFSADQRFRAFVKDVPSYVDSGRKNKKGRSIVEYVPQPAIIWRDDLYNAEEQVTYFGSGIAYDPVWSPTREQIALVSTDSGNDEIWVVNRDGSGLLQLTRDVNYDKRPSWSPDGSQIVFWSNRTGNAQVWVMKADGSDQRIINPNPFNDWNPVWIKYTDLPPLLPEPTPTSRPIFDRFN